MPRFQAPEEGGTHTELSDVNSYVSRVWATSPGVRTNRFEKLVEEGPGVVRTGGRFGVVLHREDGLRPVTEPLDRAVVEVDVCDLEFRRAGDGIDVSRYGKPVILRRDQHSP